MWTVGTDVRYGSLFQACLHTSSISRFFSSEMLTIEIGQLTYEYRSQVHMGCTVTSDMIISINGHASYSRVEIILNRQAQQDCCRRLWTLLAIFEWTSTRSFVRNLVSRCFEPFETCCELVVNLHLPAVNHPIFLSIGWKNLLRQRSQDLSLIVSVVIDNVTLRHAELCSCLWLLSNSPRAGLQGSFFLLERNSLLK